LDFFQDVFFSGDKRTSAIAALAAGIALLGAAFLLATDITVIHFVILKRYRSSRVLRDAALAASTVPAWDRGLPRRATRLCWTTGGLDIEICRFRE
jgi:hypothetical protein